MQRLLLDVFVSSLRQPDLCTCACVDNPRRKVHRLYARRPWWLATEPIVRPDSTDDVGEVLLLEHLNCSERTRAPHDILGCRDERQGYRETSVSALLCQARGGQFNL